MPYLNEARIIGHMAHEPEMSMLANGVPYCYFAIRMVQRTPDGEVSEDFIRIIAYGDMAVTVARDIRMGDLVLCNGRLSPKQWRNAAGREEYQLHFIAEEVERLAMGDGMLPPVTITDAAKARAAAFRCGEEGFIHSDTYRFRGVKDPNPPKLFVPQPNDDGSWTVPEEYVSQEASTWIAKEKKRQKQKQDDYGIVDALKTQPVKNNIEADRIAASLISWNLPRTEDGQMVKIPNAKTLPVARYNAILKSQEAILSQQAPSIRERIIDLAQRRGIVFPQSIIGETQQNVAQTQQLAAPRTQPPSVQQPVVGSSNPDAWFKD